MAKRKRLTPAQPEYLHAPLEVKSAAPGAAPIPTPPIAQVAGEAAAQAALAEVSAELQAARIEGRMVQKIPLEAIDAEYLSRDRILSDAEDLTALVDSIRAHGQRSPIEVMALKDGRFGLISGWRRLSALELLSQETGEPRFGQALALLRQPEGASEAYIAMVEENEIRVGLSYYERARVVALAAREGVFVHEGAALTRLFANSSRAKRSKIRAFLTLYNRLDEVLRFPTQIGERLGLSLAKLLEQDATSTLADRLRAADVRTPEDELAILAEAVAPGAAPALRSSRPSPAPRRGDILSDRDEPRKAARAPTNQPDPVAGIELRPGVFLKNEGGYLKPRLVIAGPNVDRRFQEMLESWLKNQS